MRRTGGALVPFVIALVSHGLASAGCGDGAPSGIPDGSVDATAADAGPPDAARGDGGSELLDDRPYGMDVPAGYDPSEKWPLVVMLHGYSGSASAYQSFFDLQPLVDSEGFLYAYPEGTTDNMGLRFWNATEACCDLDGSGVDDVAYLSAVVDDIIASWSVDEKRIYFIGHSNGAFMASRMACERADMVAAFVAISGAGFLNPEDCHATEPVAARFIHGDADGIIEYDGGRVIFGDADYPSAFQSVSGWGQRNGCIGNLQRYEPDLDLVDDDALDTKVEKFVGCPPGGDAELFTIFGEGHLPGFHESVGQMHWDFLSAHSD